MSRPPRLHAELLERRTLLSSGGPSASVPIPAAPGTDATVAGRYIFFNHSAFDGNDAAANASDDAAVSPAVEAIVKAREAGIGGRS